MQVEFVAVANVGGLRDVIHAQRLAGLRIFKAQKTSMSEVLIVGLDCCDYGVEVECPVGFEGQGLGLNPTQDRGSTGFKSIGMSLFPRNVLISPTTVTQQGA